MNKKDLFKDLTIGTIIEVTFKDYDREIETGKYFFTGKELQKIDGPWSTISLIDIDDDLNVFSYDYSKIFISKVLMPKYYEEIYNNELKVKMTKKQIEDKLGYKIEIVKE